MRPTLTVRSQSVLQCAVLRLSSITQHPCRIMLKFSLLADGGSIESFWIGSSLPTSKTPARRRSSRTSRHARKHWHITTEQAMSVRSHRVTPGTVFPSQSHQIDLCREQILCTRRFCDCSTWMECVTSAYITCRLQAIACGSSMLAFEVLIWWKSYLLRRIKQ